MNVVWFALFCGALLAMEGVAYLAHLAHHRTHGREGAVSFGFLWAPASLGRSGSAEASRPASSPDAVK